MLDVALMSGGQFKPASLGNLELGARALTMDSAKRLATIYGITLEELLYATAPQLAELAKGRA